MFKNPLIVRAVVIFLLGLFFMLPLALISGVVAERHHTYAAAKSSVAASWTGPQQITGPLLLVEFETAWTEQKWNRESKRYEVIEQRAQRRRLIMPDLLTMQAELDTSYRKLGIFDVPVFVIKLRMNGTFSTAVLAGLPQDERHFDKVLDVSFVVGVSDQRGIAQTGELDFDGNNYVYAAGTRSSGLGAGIHAVLPQPLEGDQWTFAADFELRGSQSVGLTPLAGAAALSVTSNWQHPGFSGRFLPYPWQGSDAGFSAEWALSALATNASERLRHCSAGECDMFHRPEVSIKLVEPLDLYASVTRAVKYGLLFILTTFVACFLVETITGRKLHPFHYVLVGFAQALFFLLIVSLAEHIAFGAAYALATLGCSGLIAVYLSSVLSSKRLGLVFGAGVAGVLAMLYAILKSEDHALLMGSLMLFAMLALVMMLTRRVDWYRVKP